MVELQSVANPDEPDAPTPPTSEESESSHSDPGTQLQPEPPNRRSWWPFSLFSSRKKSPYGPQDRFKDLTYESVSSYPLGYPSWAAYQNSDPTFRVYKRFGTLRNRVLLHKQQRLSKLQQRLLQLDESDDVDHNYRIRSVHKDQDDNESERTALMQQIEDELREYDDLIERERRSMKMQKPTKLEYQSLVNYLWNRKPIYRSEMKFLEHQDDFVLLSQESDSPIERVIDGIVSSIPIARIRYLFSSEGQTDKFDKTKDKYTYLTSTEKIRNSARAVAAIFAILVIGIPLYILAFKDFSDRIKLGVLLVSLIAFPAAISVSARPKNHDLFVATATYCAVLSTFLAASNSFNIGQSGTSAFQNSYNGTIYH